MVQRTARAHSQPAKGSGNRYDLPVYIQALYTCNLGSRPSPSCAHFHYALAANIRSNERFHYALAANIRSNERFHYAHAANIQSKLYSSLL